MPTHYTVKQTQRSDTVSQHLLFAKDTLDQTTTCKILKLWNRRCRLMGEATRCHMQVKNCRLFLQHCTSWGSTSVWSSLRSFGCKGCFFFSPSLQQEPRVTHWGQKEAPTANWTFLNSSFKVVELFGWALGVQRWTWPQRLNSEPVGCPPPQPRCRPQFNQKAEWRVEILLMRFLKWTAFESSLKQWNYKTYPK